MNRTYTLTATTTISDTRKENATQSLIDAWRASRAARAAHTAR